MLTCARSVVDSNDEAKAQLCQPAGSADRHQGPAEEKVTVKKLAIFWQCSVCIGPPLVFPTCRTRVHPETPVAQVKGKKQTSLKVFQLNVLASISDIMIHSYGNNACHSHMLCPGCADSTCARACTLAISLCLCRACMLSCC